MNLKRRSLAFVLVLVLLTSVAVVSAQGGETASVVQFLYVRVLPDVEAQNYGRLGPGTEVTLIGRTSNSRWLKLQTADGIIGWGRANALEYAGDVSALPVANVGPTQGVVVNSASLSENPTADAAASGILGQGVVVDVVAANADGSWVYVTGADTASWAHADALAYPNQTLPDVPWVNASVNGIVSPRVLPDLDAYAYPFMGAGTPANLIGRSSDGNWVRFETVDGAIAWGRTRAFVIEGSVDDLPVADVGPMQGVVLAFAALHENPVVESAGLGRLDQGAVVDVVAAELEDEWVYVTNGDVTGWARADALVYPGGAIPDVPRVNGSVNGIVSPRVLPDLDALAYDFIGAGVPVNVLGRTEDGNWVQFSTMDGALTAWGRTRAFVLEGRVNNLPVTAVDPAMGVVLHFAVLRAAPDAAPSDADVRVPQGTLVEPQLVFGNHVYIRAANGAEGWARIDAIAFVNGVVPASVPHDNATVAPTENVEVVNLRLAPSADAPRFGWAAVGERLAVVGQNADGQWYYVAPVTRARAWVFAPLVALDAGAGPFPVVEAPAAEAPAAEAPAEAAPAAEAPAAAAP